MLLILIVLLLCLAIGGGGWGFHRWGGYSFSPVLLIVAIALVLYFTGNLRLR